MKTAIIVLAILCATGCSEKETNTSEASTSSIKERSASEEKTVIIVQPNSGPTQADLDFVKIRPNTQKKDMGLKP